MDVNACIYRLQHLWLQSVARFNVTHSQNRKKKLRERSTVIKITCTVHICSDNRGTLRVLRATTVASNVQCRAAPLWRLSCVQVMTQNRPRINAPVNQRSTVGRRTLSGRTDFAANFGCAAHPLTLRKRQLRHGYTVGLRPKLVVAGCREWHNYETTQKPFATWHTRVVR